MVKAKLVIIDFCPCSQLGRDVELQLRAGSTLPLEVQRETFSDGRAAREQMAERVAAAAPDLLILHHRPETGQAAGDVLRDLSRYAPGVPVLAIIDSASRSALSQLLQSGASLCLAAPFTFAELERSLLRLSSTPGKPAPLLSILKESLGLQQFVGYSEALWDQLRRIPAAARCDAGVLITGETGTGKEICARAIHYSGARANRPFVPLNCGAIPVDLVENELFGHEAGAFTSANGSRTGVIQEAIGGTLFLDEIDSLPFAAQVKLLRFLQEKEYRPLGASAARKADVRIIAASNAPLEDLLNSGKMRKDLFYRLNVLRFRLPPLRERKEDVPLLVHHFMTTVSSGSGRAAVEISPGALRRLSHYDWPGNVRELENVIERAMLLCGGRMIQPEDIDLPAIADEAPESLSFRLLKEKAVAAFEQNYVRSALEQWQGNIAQAARAAQKNRRVFFRLMRKYNISVQRLADPTVGQPLVKVVIDMDKNVRPSVRR